MEGKVKFSFINYFSNLICRSEKGSTILYNYGLENFSKWMGIKTYLQFQIEMKFLKEVILDKNQRHVLKILTKLINFKRFFEKNTDLIYEFSEYKQEDFKEFYDSIKLIFDKKDLISQKIIEFIDVSLYQ